MKKSVVSCWLLAVSVALATGARAASAAVAAQAAAGKKASRAIFIETLWLKMRLRKETEERVELTAFPRKVPSAAARVADMVPPVCAAEADH